MAKKFITSPVGVAAYPHLNKKDTQFDAEGIYHVEIKVTKEEAAAFKKKLMDLVSDHTFKTKKVHIPIAEAKDGDGYVIKTKSKFKPVLFDSKNRPLSDDIRIGGGSELRFIAEVRPYEKNGEGISLGLKQVQIVKLVEGGGGASAFDAVDDGFEVSEDNSEELIDADDL